ncbi:SprT-like domain-containing protein [Halosegnis longus]|uniref:SprT-like domain-containing protein n=1 Tax=Halosegnis longus TaxID=2216012 RepID=UPI00096A97C7|nr:SprT-like domain-containing protein [Salella cibi]
MWPPGSHDALLEYARSYADSVPLPVDTDSLDWEVSTRAKQRAGACTYDGDAITIRLAWGAAKRFDRAQFERVIRHELIHAWEYQTAGEAGHGARFRKQADRLDVSVTCPAFTTPRLRLECTNCAWTADRHRASAVVTGPETRRCGECGARYEVEHLASGERWRTAAGYRGARERIESW